MRRRYLLALLPLLTACAGAPTAAPWPVSYQHPCPVAATTPLPIPDDAVGLPDASRRRYASKMYQGMQTASDEEIAREAFDVPNLAPAFRVELVRMLRLVVQNLAYREGLAPPISDEDRAWYWRWRCNPDTMARMRQLRSRTTP